MTMSNGQRISVKFIAELVGVAIVFAAIVGSHRDSTNKIDNNSEHIEIVEVQLKEERATQTTIRLDQREIRTNVEQIQKDIGEIKQAVK